MPLFEVAISSSSGARHMSPRAEIGGVHTRTPRIPLKRKLLYSLVTIALAVAFAEIVVRAVVTSTRGRLLYETDPRLGYRLRPNLDVTRQRDDAPWSFRTDSQGRRRVPQPQDGTSENTVVIVGDSLVFGDGVDDDETVAAHIARKGFHVVNLGVPGYGTHQELLALRRYLEHSRADYVVTVVAANDFDDVLSSYQHMRHRPTASLRDSKLQLDEFRAPFSDYLIDRSYLFALLRYANNHPIRNAGDGPAVVAACLSAINAEALRAGSMPLFFAHDAHQGEPLRKLHVEAQQRGLTVVDLSPVLNGMIREVVGADGVHWNAKGHRVVADIMLEQLK
jgi:hypothetical protein